MGVAPRKPLGGGGWDSVPNLASGYCAMQNVGIWAIAQLREGAPNFKYGVFKLPTPPGGKYTTIGGGWAFVANAKGSNPKAAGEFCAWALGSMGTGATERVVDWCTKAKSDMPPRRSALEAGKAAYDTRLPQGLRRRGLSGRPRRAAHAPARLQGDLGRDPGLPAERPEARGGRGGGLATRSTRSSRATRARRSSRRDGLPPHAAGEGHAGRREERDV